ncbi:hypothetical protein [Cloacibacterium normanense]|uniref:hypothetical protein n=1 Tax=Cloacibacterium normanense TaxID=237258 RepID=UPI00352F0742
MNFERIFNDYCNLLDKHKEQLYLFQFYPENLNEVKKTLKSEENIYSYTFSTIRLVIPKSLRPNHSIPKNLGSVEIILSIKDEIKIKKTKKNFIEDPLNKLEKFNIILNCENSHYTSSWHLDRHAKDGDGELPSNLHPIYHLTFGGYHMENLQREDSDEFGKSLILRAPRIMHPPMELLLGIDFIFNHFIPKNELELLSDPAYIFVIKELKKYFWLPFSLAIAKNYCERISINNEPFSFDELFVSSVLSC